MFIQLQTPLLLIITAVFTAPCTMSAIFFAALGNFTQIRLFARKPVPTIIETGADAARLPERTVLFHLVRNRRRVLP